MDINIYSSFLCKSRKWKQLRCPSLNGLMVRAAASRPCQRRSELLSHATWMISRELCWAKKSNPKRLLHPVWFHLFNICKWKNFGDGGQIGGCQGWARGGGGGCKGIVGTELFAALTAVLWLHNPIQVTHLYGTHTLQIPNSWGNHNKSVDYISINIFYHESAKYYHRGRWGKVHKRSLCCFLQLHANLNKI